MTLMSLDVQVEGISPLLMNRYDPKADLQQSKKLQAQARAYILGSGELYIPAVSIQRSLIAGADRVPNGTVSFQQHASVCFIVTPNAISLNRSGYEIDSRPVTDINLGKKVLRHRPRLDQWRAQFTLEFDRSLIDLDTVERIVMVTGSDIGFLDFRPEKEGPFGKFTVTKCQPIT